MKIPITNKQFEALATLAGIKNTTKGWEAMHMVFVQGKSQSYAARATETSPGYLSNAKNKIIGAHAMIPNRIKNLQEALCK